MNPLQQTASSLITLLPTPLVGIEAARLQLQQLGYKPGDHFYLKLGNNQPHRCLIQDDYNFAVTKLLARKQDDWLLLPKEKQHIRDANGRKIWDDGKSYQDGFSYLKHQAGERNFGSSQIPKDIFILPNFQGDGITSDESLGTYSIFLELDDGSFEQQLAIIEDVAQTTGLIPSQIIFSGGKSLHIYYRLSEFLTDETTRKRLQRKLIALFKSDIQIQNSNREMRFAGFWRSSKKEYQSLLFTSEYQYSAEEFESRLDSLGRFPEGLDDSRWERYVKLRNQKADDDALLKCLKEPTTITRVESRQPRTPRPSNIQRCLPQANPLGSSAIPLENFLSESDRDLLYSGVGEGGRNSTAHQLTCKLVARQERLNTLRIPSSGEARTLLEQFSASCNPPIDPQEVEQIWNSASRSRDTRLDDEYFLKKYSWWLREHDYKEWRRLFKTQWQQVSPLDAEPDAEPDLISYQEYEQREEERDRTEAAEAASRRREKEERERNTDPAEKELEKCTTIDDWKAKREELQRNNWLKSKTLTPTDIIDQEFFGFWLKPQQQQLAISLFTPPSTLPELRQKPPENLAFFGHAGTGNGKSTYQKVVNNALHPERFFSLGYRNGLLLQQCKSWGLVHLQQNGNFTLINDERVNLALCVHSLGHFEDKMHVFDGCNLIIDEVVSVVKCLLQDSLIKERQKILDLFSEAVRRCKRIFCYDANLADWVVDYISELCPEKKIIVVSNIHQPKKPSVEFFPGSLDQETEELKTSDNSAVVRSLLNSERPVLLSDSKKQVRILAEILRKAGKKVMEVCSETRDKEEVQAFLGNADQWIRDNWASKGIDGCVLMSPSAESGLDISIKNYFTDCYCLFFGVVDVDTCIQFLGRVRDNNCKFHVWIKKKGVIKNLLPNSIFPQQIEREIRRYIAEQQSAVWAGNPADEIIREFASKLLARAGDIHFNYQCKLLSFQVYEEWNLRESLRFVMEAQGWELRVMDGEIQDKGVKTEIKETRDILYEKWSQEIYAAPHLTEEQFTEIQSKLFQSEQERAAIRKFFLLSRVPGLDASPIWSAQTINLFLYQKPGLIGECEMRFLFENPDIAKLRSQAKWASALKTESLRHTDMLGDRYLAIKALHEMDLGWFLNPENSWTNTTPQLSRFCKTGKRKNIANAIGKAPGKDENKYVIGLLSRLGYEVSGTKNRRGDEWERVYQIQQNDFYARERKVILESLAQRFETQKIQRKITQRIFESKTPSNAYGGRFSAVALSPDSSLKTNAGSATDFLQFSEPESEPTTTLITQSSELHENESPPRRIMQATENDNSIQAAPLTDESIAKLEQLITTQSPWDEICVIICRLSDNHLLGLLTLKAQAILKQRYTEYQKYEQRTA